ncbi:MAG: hypothetical protein ACFFCW_26940 [Candidatus Hodarchaeota archaeon]
MAIDMHLIYTIVLLVHGLGHLLGVISIVGGLIKSPGFTTTSWVLTNRLGLSETIVRALGVLWLVPTVGFVASALGFWSDLDWWRPLTWVMVAFSVVLLTLWWKSFTANIPIQANIGNIVVIVGLLWLT